MRNLASNRQKKLLRFFGIHFSPNISSGAAGWEIANLLADDDLREWWRKYLYLTKDFDSDTDQLKPFDQEELNAVVIPDDWHSSDEKQKFKDELIANLLENNNNAPYDNPQPVINFLDSTFAFTGKFDFGARRECQNAVVGLGGVASNKINGNLNYLVIGTQGSPCYKRGAYGTKIEKAILSRRKFGSPSILSEDHWTKEMAKHC
ncbi:MAG: hypothetical protein D3918_15670 [Candidatus Electrothrix sp. AX2]|nr:hypothetical protein [Candidatus Electrothrix gigas]